MKKLRKALVVILLLAITLGGIAAGVTLNGIYMNGNTGAVTHYDNGVLDWHLPLEGNFSSYSLLWHSTYKIGGQPNNAVMDVLIVNEVNKTVLTCDDASGSVRIFNLTNGVIISGFDGEYSYYGVRKSSVLGTYFAIIEYASSPPIYLNIYKYGALLQHLDVSTLTGWATSSGEYFTTISADGKYIMLSNYNAGVCEVALFEGS